MASYGLPSGARCRIEARGPKAVVGDLGALIGHAVVCKETGEPLQYLSSTSDADALVKQWDAVFEAAWRRAQP